MSEFDINLQAQEVLHGKDIRTAMLSGLTLLANAVRATLGPRGRNVAIYSGKNTKPHLTKDGVTVAKAIKPSNMAERLGVEFVKEVSKQACNEAGDGTTTATVLAAEIVYNCIEYIDSNDTANPVAMQRGIEHAAKCLQERMLKNSTPCTTREQMIRVATISANGDAKIGEMAGNTVYDAGEYGCVLVEENKQPDDSVINTRGIRLDNGMMGSGFITNQAEQLQEIEDAYLVMIDGEIKNLDDINKLLLEVPVSATVLLVADDFDKALVSVLTQARTTLARNPNRRVAALAMVKSSGYGLRRKEMLRDLAAYTGGKVTGPEGDVCYEDFTVGMCGRATKVILDRANGIVISDNGDQGEIKGRIKLIEQQMVSNSPSLFEVSNFKKRIGLLAGKVWTIRVGADTQIGMRERKDRFDDAVCAVASAREKGVLAGGGTALITASLQLPHLETTSYVDDFVRGYHMTLEAIQAPVIHISQNAGLDGRKTAAKVIKGIQNDILKDGMSNFGYNADTGIFGDMLEMNVLDPAKVTCSAIKYAAAIAGSIITTEVGIIG